MNQSAHQTLLTVRDLVRYGVSRLRQAQVAIGHGSDNAWDEAVYLVLHGLDLPLDTLEPFLDARLLQEERERVLTLIEQRISQRIPAAYLTHEAWLRGRRFYVDSRVIVPRSPIAELLDEGLTPWIEDPDGVHAVLDMCTGSGCLAILAAQAFPGAQIKAVDICPEALAVARQNVQAYQLQARIDLQRSDLFAQLLPHAYDLIICNPPYVNRASMEVLPAEYRHEPALALAGGEDGMALIRHIVAQAGQFLCTTGILVLEIGHERAHFEAAFPHLQPVWLDTSQASDQILLLTRAQLVS